MHMTTTHDPLNHIDIAIDAMLTAALHTIALDPALNAAINSRDDSDAFLAYAILTCHRFDNLILDSIINALFAILDALDIDDDMLTMRIERISDRDL